MIYIVFAQLLTFQALLDPRCASCHVASWDAVWVPETARTCWGSYKATGHGSS